MIAILEDDVEFRHKWFREKFPNALIFVSAQDFINFVEERHDEIHLMFLDHDLADFGQNVTEGAYGKEQTTGWHVAHYIASKNLCNHDECQIIIHSVNPAGSERMYNTFVGNGYTNVDRCAFTSLIKVMRIKGE